MWDLFGNEMLHPNLNTLKLKKNIFLLSVCDAMMLNPIFVGRQMGRALAPPTTLGIVSAGTEKRLRVSKLRVFRVAAGSWRDESEELSAEAAGLPSIAGITEVVKQMVLFFSFRGEAVPSGSHGWKKKKGWEFTGITNLEATENKNPGVRIKCSDKPQEFSVWLQKMKQINMWFPFGYLDFFTKFVFVLIFVCTRTLRVAF